MFGDNDFIIEKVDEIGRLRARLAELEARLATLEAPPVVPRGWAGHARVYQERDADDVLVWAVDVDVMDTPADQAQTYRALAWAIETNTRPPHASDGKEGGE